MYKNLFLMLIMLLFSFKLRSTAQIPDLILIDGVEYSLNVNPLNDYFDSNSISPQSFTTNEDGTVMMSTGLWRGYQAIFEIKNDTLYVNKIRILSTIDDIEWEVVTDSIFATEQSKAMRFYTGKLIIPFGEQVRYVHMGYGSEYEFYKIIEIIDGQVIRIIELNHTEFATLKNRKFKQFQETETYKEQYSEMKKEGDSDEFINSFLKSFYFDQYILMDDD